MAIEELEEDIYRKQKELKSLETDFENSPTEA
jgi:hypothetical protein